MAKPTTLTLKDAFETKTANRKSSITLKDATATVKMKLQSAPKTNAVADVQHFLQAKEQVDVSRKTEYADGRGNLNETGTWTGQFASEMFGLISKSE